ncbi:MAG: TetR/AcrR family transcriptional regulator [Marmoricola sp.]
MARPSVEAERKEQILAATRKVVAERGFKAMRVSDVAKLSGTSTGTIHYYFETKQDLMHAVFEWNYRKSEERRAALLDGINDPPLRIRALLRSFLPEGEVLLESWNLWIALWIEAIHDSDLQDLNERIYGDWRRSMAAIIREGQATGDFIEGDSVTLANGLISMVDGLAMQVLTGSQSMTVERMSEVCELAVSLIAAR